MKKLICSVMLVMFIFAGSFTLAQNKVVVVPLGGTKGAGTNGQFQYNDAGKVAGAELYYDKDTGEIKTGVYRKPGIWESLNNKCKCLFPYRLSPGAETDETKCLSDTGCYWEGLFVSQEGVGVGTINPRNGLSVDGDIALASWLELYEWDAASYFDSTKHTGTVGVENNILWLFTQQDNAKIALWTGVGGTIQLATNNSNRVTVASNGRVGVGTESPQATLDINGFARLTPQSSAPVGCGVLNYTDGAIALTSNYTMCVCRGTGTRKWIHTHDGSDCVW